MAPKILQKGPFGLFIIQFIAKNQNNQRGDLWRHQDILEKNLTMLKKAIKPSEMSSNNKSFNQTGSSQVSAISKVQNYSKNNYWKQLEKLFFFQKNKLNFFFRKKVFFKKSHNAEKLKKRPFRLIKRFYKPKTSKKMQGVTL